jgi:Trk K+ transport system NAD-binding subunit
MRQHFILCGLGKIGWRVLEYLLATGEKVVVINLRPPDSDPRLQNVTLIVGDCRQESILKQAGLDDARGVLILTSEDLVNLSTALMVRHLHPNIRILVRMFNQQLIPRLGQAANNMIALSTSALASPLLALIARTGEALGLLQLKSGEHRQITEFSIAPHSAFIGQSLNTLAQAHRFIVVAHRPANQPLRFIREVDLSARLGVFDRVIAFGEPETLKPLVAHGENESLPELLWAGFLRRLTRVLYSGLALIDIPVKVCTPIFLGVIVISVIVFHFGMSNDTLVDAFYRTISLLATGADMHGDDPALHGTWQKAFISALRLVGTGLTAAFTAILTNYLIRANLGGALEIRRIPESGHIIVCGLGNVGFRVVEELLAQGEQVVAIENNPNSPFIPTARRLGAAVIVGSAAMIEVLKQARVTTARSVVAAISNELLNLEIALLVREIAPRQRVVLRLIDPHLAMTLRQAANIRLAFSIPDLAAPAFVANLYDNQIRSLFQVEGRILAIYELTLQDRHLSLAHSTLNTLITAFGFLPVHHVGKDGQQRPIQFDNIIVVGDCITGIIALEDVQRLFHSNLLQTKGS